MEKVYHISMSESIKQLKLDDPPQIVLLNPSIQKCNGCSKIFKDHDRKPPKDIVFKLYGRKCNHYEGGERVPGKPQPTFYCVWDLACIHMQRKNIHFEDIYISSFYMNSLTEAHVKLLKQRGFWKHILSNRARKNN